MKTTFLILSVLLAAGCATRRPEPQPVKTSAQIVEEHRQQQAERRAAHLGQHPELSEQVRTAISSGSLVRGMTEADVVASIGAPGRVNRTVTAAGESIQWVYGERSFLYFRGGKLEAWQD